MVHALPALRRLTRLELVFEEPTRPPAALAHAPELRELSLYSGARDGALPQGCQLPAGPWPQLRQLEASWPRLRSSVANLFGMGRLEKLNINSHPWLTWLEPASWGAFGAWATGCPTLTSLFVWWCQDEGNQHEDDDELLRSRRAAGLANFLLALQRGRPLIATSAEYVVL